jgi:hypothetical protein
MYNLLTKNATHAQTSTYDPTKACSYFTKVPGNQYFGNKSRQISSQDLHLDTALHDQISGQTKYTRLVLTLAMLPQAHPLATAATSTAPASEAPAMPKQNRVAQPQ